MPRFIKLLIWLIALPLLLILVLVGLLFLPAVQTFIVHRALASKPEIKAQVETVAVSLGGARLQGLRYEQPGLLVTLPSFEAELPLKDLLDKKLDLRRLFAHDVAIVIDPAAAAAGAPAPAKTSTSAPFAGVLNSFALPFSLYAEGVDLAGTIQVKGAQPVDAVFSLKGGGIAPGANGTLTLTLNATASQGKVISELILRPSFGTDGSLGALTLVLNATAESTTLAKPASAKTELSIARAGDGETYLVRVATGAEPLLELATSWAPGAAQPPGRWKVALTNADLAPFLLGVALPTFRAQGEGEVSATSADSFRVAGKLAIAADSLERMAGAPALGPISADLSFGVSSKAGRTSVETFGLLLSSAAPVLSLELRQPFELDLATKKLTPSRPGAELCDLVLLGLPPAWIKSFAPAGLTLNGPLTGAWVFVAEDDGFSATSSAPLIIPGFRLDSASKPQWVFDKVQVEGSRVRYNTTGLTAGIEALRFSNQGQEALSLSLDLERKATAPLSLKGEIRSALSVLTAQPALAGTSRLSGGLAVVTYDAVLGDTLSAKAGLSLVGLRAGIADELPEMVLKAELSRQADGVMMVKLPLIVRNSVAGRSSDIELSATLTPRDGQTNVLATLTSLNLHIPDLQVFSALAPATTSAPATVPAPTASAPTPQPVWAGYTGKLNLVLDRVVYAPGLEVTKIEGAVALTPDALSMQGFKAMLSGGVVNLGAALNFIRSANTYNLVADLGARDLASGPLLRALAPNESVPLEGLFNLEAKVQGQGSDPAAAAKTAGADIKITGRNGMLRALNLETNRYARAGSAIAGLAGLAGALSGNSELALRGAQVSALNDVARQLGKLPFDDLVIAARRGAGGELEIGELKLNSPVLTLAGSGAVANQPGRGFADQPLLLNLTLGARGQLAGSLQTLGLLAPAAADAPADALRALSEPLVFDGSLREVGTKQATRLLARALRL